MFVRTIAVTSLVALSFSFLAQSALGAEGRWESSMQSFERQDAANPPKPGGVMFLGSSSIRMWKLDAHFPDLGAVNRGFGGSQISDSIEHFDRLVLPHRPRLIVFYAGDNDIAAGESPESVVADFDKFVKLLEEKNGPTRVIFVSIKVCGARWSNVDKVRKANARIKAICEKNPRLDFMDTEPIMLDEDGIVRDELFLKDRLHLNEDGYKLWDELLRSLLKEDAAGEKM